MSLTCKSYFSFHSISIYARKFSLNQSYQCAGSVINEINKILACIHYMLVWSQVYNFLKINLWYLPWVTRLARILPKRVKCESRFQEAHNLYNFWSFIIKTFQKYIYKLMCKSEYLFTLTKEITMIYREMRDSAFFLKSP